jgi:G:T/U-mismatch repair DNA glycosylase
MILYFMTQQIEIHPWNWQGPKDSKVLIVGTFPPTRRNWSFDFFYPNKNNFFWRVIAAIAGHTLENNQGPEARKEREELLHQLKITLTDMGQTIIRNFDSSLDENIHPQQYMDISKILAERPSIQKIIFTSSSGKNSAAAWFKRYAEERNIALKYPKGPKPLRLATQILGRKIELVILHSTSARAANRISFEKLVDLYKNEILCT